MLPEFDQPLSLDILRIYAQTGDPAAIEAYKAAYQDRLRMLSEQAHTPGISPLERTVIETSVRNLATFYSQMP